MPEISILYKLKKPSTSLNIFLSFLNFTNYVYVILIYHCKSQDSNHLFILQSSYYMFRPLMTASKK